MSTSTVTNTAVYAAHDATAKRIPMVGSYEGVIPSQHVRWMRPTEKDTPLPEMRARLEEDGYLFVKGLLPRQDVLDVREAYFAPYESLGLLKPGTSPVDGVFNDNENPLNHTGIGGGDLPANEHQIKLQTQSHQEPTYLKFLENADFRGTVRQLMDWDQEVLLKRTMLRHNIPEGHVTGVHYDKLFLRHGDDYFLTAWVPLGDISANGGGLMYLSDSVPVGRGMEEDFNHRAADFTDEQRKSAFNLNMGKYGMLSQDAADFHKGIGSPDVPGTDDHGGKARYWLITEYEAGDVVFHDPYMIHSSTKNQDAQGRMRLGTDLRFYKEGSSLDERWMKDFWKPGDGL